MIPPAGVGGAGTDGYGQGSHWMFVAMGWILLLLEVYWCR